MLIRSPDQLKLGFLAVLLTAVLYNLVSIFLFIGKGYPSSFKPWLAISADNYYKYNMFFIMPSMFLSYVASSAVIYLVSRAIGRKGTFDQTISLIRFSVSLASWTTLSHD